MKKIYNIVIIAICAGLLFIFEQALSFLPNIQITFLLIILYSKNLKTKDTLLIILIHVLLDNLFNGSFLFHFVIPMFIGYAIIPISLNTIFKNKSNILFLAILSIIFSIFYAICFIIPSCYVYEIKYSAYILSDIPFTIILSMSSFLTVLWLLKPLNNMFRQILSKNNNVTKEK